MSVNIQETFQKMPLGDKIMLIAAPLFFIASFLPWFKYDLGIGSVTRTGWSGDFSFLTIIAVLLAVALFAGIVAMRFANVKLPTLPEGVTWARVDLGVAVYIALAVLIRLLMGESAGSGDFSVDADMQFGIWLAAIIAAALVAGAFLNFQAERQGGGATTSSM